MRRSLRGLNAPRSTAQEIPVVFLHAGKAGRAARQGFPQTHSHGSPIMRDAVGVQAKKTKTTRHRATMDHMLMDRALPIHAFPTRKIRAGKRACARLP